MDIKRRYKVLCVAAIVCMLETSSSFLSLRRLISEQRSTKKSQQLLEPMELGDAIDEVVRLLLPVDQANDYIEAHPGNDFRFYVYDTIPEKWSYQHVNQCAFKHQHELSTEKNVTYSNCDWGLSMCTETQSSTTPYSTRRFNRNADAILAKAFSEYQGPLRTYDPMKAQAFIVPYPASGHCACHNLNARCSKIKNKDIEKNVIANLQFYNETTKARHIFMSSSQGDINHPFMKNRAGLLTIEPNAKLCTTEKNCGQVTIPYANTNPDYQPNVLLKHHLKRRESALGSAITRTKVFQGRGKAAESKPQIRELFMQEASDYLKNGTQTLAGWQTKIVGLNHKLQGRETAYLELYRDSIFCPILRGDTPAQKRFFDVLLSGCIPVVMQYESNEKGYPSFWDPRTMSTRLVYPFAKGIFYGMPEMGLDITKLVVPINGTCGVKCIFPTLEDLLLNRPEEIVEIQQNIARVASLFSYSMEENTFKYPDAIVGTLVRIRHYVNQLEKIQANQVVDSISETNQSSTVAL